MFRAFNRRWWRENYSKYHRFIVSWCDKVSINTAAVKNVGFVKEASKKFGSQCIVVVDAKNVSDDKCRFYTEEEIKSVLML